MPERLKVLSVHAGGGLGGAPISLIQMLASLPPDAFEPLVAFTEPGPMVEWATGRGLRTFVVPARALFFYSAHAALRLRTLLPFVVHYRASLGAAERLLASQRPDVLHLNTSVLLPFGAAARRLGVPVVWHVREVLGANPWLRRWHGAFICRHASVVAATSQAVGACLPCALHVEIVPNAVDLDQYQLALRDQRREIRRALGVAESARLVAILGSVQRVKGHWVLLEALARLRARLPEVQALVVAGGVSADYARSWKGRLKRSLGLPLDNLDALQRDAARRGLSSLLHPTGFRTDIPRLLAACDVLVFPSCRPEGFGRPLIEAMAMALPVVATDLGPAREIVEPGDTALLVPPGDPAALAEALFQVLGEPGLAERLGRRGRRRVEELFALPQHVQRMAELFHLAAGGVCYPQHRHV